MIMLINLILLFFTCFFGHSSIADQGSGADIRLVGLGGFSQANLTGTSTPARLDSPLGFSLAVDYGLSPQWDFGVEHMRTLSNQGSVLGISSATLKWYFWFPSPRSLAKIDRYSLVPTLLIEGIIPYLGASLGVAQSGYLNPEDTTLGLNIGIKAGMDYPLFGDWGLRGEFNFASSSGTGSAMLLNLIGGVYRYF
jgi:hypothetical protein